MNDSFYKQLIMQSPFGYSCHKMIYNDEGDSYDCEFIEVNHAFEKLTGLKNEDLIGRSVTEVFSDNNKGESNWKNYLKSIDNNGEIKEFEYFLQRVSKWLKINVCFQDKEYFTLNLTDITKERNQISKLKKSNERLENIIEGTPLLMSGSHTDITEKNKAENTLNESMTLLNETMHISKIGSWKWNLNTKQIIWSEEMYEIFGIDRDAVIGRLGDAISRIVHPDDLHIFEDASAISKKEPFEYRIILPDNSIRHILAKRVMLLLMN